MFEEIPESIVNQRTRNRVIEVLDYYAIVDNLTPLKPTEILEMWDEWVDDNQLESFQKPAFTDEEIEAISRFHENWKQFCDELPKTISNARELIVEPAWTALVEQSKICLTILMKRGLLSENREHEG